MVWASTHGQTVRGEDDEARYIVSHFLDVTAVKLAEQRHREASTLFETAFADATAFTVKRCATFTCQPGCPQSFGPDGFAALASTPFRHVSPRMSRCAYTTPHLPCGLRHRRFTAATRLIGSMTLPAQCWTDFIEHAQRWARPGICMVAGR